MTIEEPSRADSGRAGRLAVWLATGLGVGLATPAPGTVGGLWGLLLLPPIAALEPLAAQLLALFILCIAAAIICSHAAEQLGAAKDPGAIVLDEIVALPIVFLGIGTLSFAKVAVGYLLFRWMDIRKPWPVRQAEQLSGGWGIVADDCVAAAYAGVMLHLLLAVDRVSGLGWLDA